MLGKPPVVQVWIQIQFEPANQARVQPVEDHVQFLERFQDEYPVIEAVQEPVIQLRRSRRKGRVVLLPEHKNEIYTIRARTQDEGRWLGLMPDLLIFNYLRKAEGDYPGFTALRTEALAKCREYLDAFRPNGVKAVALHYVDLIDIAEPADEPLLLENYVHITANYPVDRFGPAGDFDIRLTTRPPGYSQPVHVRCCRERSMSDTRGVRVRLEWHTVGLSEMTTDLGLVQSGLDDAHSRLIECFRASVTDRTWQLFEPNQLQ